MKGAYYNEFDPKAGAWLRELIKDNLIAPGDVDERSILNVKAQEIRGYTQYHFFAGIGGWSRALRIAGWPDRRPVGTGSCPCQPLSCAGLGKGHADERHLWPAFFDLIAELGIATWFGEQVASADGREWFAGIRADLEGVGYACGAADLCSAGVGAPNIRQRLYWLGESIEPRLEGHAGNGDDRNEPGRIDADQARPASAASAFGGLGDSAILGRNGSGFQEHAEQQGAHGLFADGSSKGGFWSGSQIILCRDGKRRRIPLEPGLFPLAARIPGRMALLRGAGNAINPEVAALFIKAAMTEIG